jgi:WD40 repeat protein
MPAIGSRSTPSATAGELMEVMTLKGHETSVNYLPNGPRLENLFPVSISYYFPDGKQMISGSGDKTVRLWDLEAGKEIEEARVVRGQGYVRLRYQGIVIG